MNHEYVSILVPVSVNEQVAGTTGFIFWLHKSFPPSWKIQGTEKEDNDKSVGVCMECNCWIRSVLHFWERVSRWEGVLIEMKE